MLVGITHTPKGILEINSVGQRCWTYAACPRPMLYLGMHLPARPVHEGLFVWCVPCHMFLWLKGT